LLYLPTVLPTGPHKSAESDEVLGMLQGIDDVRQLNQASGAYKEH
jgi:hypothetical protein